MRPVRSDLMCRRHRARWRVRAGAILWLAFWGLATGGGPACLGQNPVGGRGEGSPQTEAAESIFMPAERSLLMLLDRTHLLLDEGRYAEAVRCLDTILGGREDYFFKPDRDARPSQPQIGGGGCSADARGALSPMSSSLAIARQG